MGLAGVRGSQGQQRGRLRHFRASKVVSRLRKLEQGYLVISGEKISLPDSPPALL